jgi:hypothetical protein
MIQIEDKIISKEVFEKKFLCDLNSCKGSCCVEGDSGAPLSETEVITINKIYPKIKSYLSKEGRSVINNLGISVIDADGDLTTPLINNRECAFVIKEKGISKCAIEKAHSEGKSDFKKPISCHLFPIRITEYSDFDAVNYESIKICSPACSLGEEMQLPVYRFLKEPLIRKYGDKFYKEITKVAEFLNSK